MSAKSLRELEDEMEHEDIKQTGTKNMEWPTFIISAGFFFLFVVLCIVNEEWASKLIYGEYNKFCVNSIEKKASLLDWC